MLRLSLFVCSFTHVDTLLSFMFVSFWFFPHCLPFSRLFLFWGEFEKARSLLSLAHAHTYIHSETLTPLTYGIIMRARVSWEIRRKNSYGTRIHSRLRRQRRPLLSRTTVAACMACLFCSVVQKRRTNQNKIYRQLPTATHTNACTHAHTRPRVTSLAIKRFVCVCCLSVCLVAMIVRLL